MLAGGDGLFIGVCLLVTSQFRIVQQQLESLGREEPPGTAVNPANPTAAKNDQILAQLKLIAQRHNQAIEISREMSSLFMPNVFAVYTIAAVKIGLACLILMQVGPIRLTLKGNLFGDSFESRWVDDHTLTSHSKENFPSFVLSD